MTELKKYWPLVLLLSIGLNAYLIYNKQTRKIIIDPVIGKFEPATPISQKPVGEPLVVTWKTEKEIIEIHTEGKVNDSLLNIYTDSITTLEGRLKLYTDAITYRKFSHTFEDDYLKAEVSGITQGYLERVSIDRYEIKRREIDIPTFYRVLAGMEIGNNTLLSDFRYKVNAGLQTHKGIVYRASYSKQGLTDYIWIGADFTIFKF